MPPGWKSSYTADELVEVGCPRCGNRSHADLAREFGLAVARCASCRLVYTRTRLPEPQAHYRVDRHELTEKYGDVFDGRRPHPRDPNYDEHLELLESLTSARRLLDVGSHCGFFLRRARARGWDVQGLEPSPASAALARERFGLPVTDGTLGTAELHAASFDVVTLVDVFEHIEAPVALLEEVRRVLRPGGLVFIKVPNVRYVLLKQRTLGQVPGLLDDVFDAREHAVFYSRDTLVATLEDVGLEVERVTVPSPIQVGSRVKKGVRAAGARIARLVSPGTPLATDLVAVARR